MAALIRHGKLCSECTPTKCADVGSESESISIECPLCCGKGCDECEDGMTEIRGCPNAYCSRLVSTIELIDLFGKGLPPVAGGMLDQSVSFIQAARFLDLEERRIRSGE